MRTVDILPLQKEIHEKARKISVLCTSNLTTKIAHKSRSCYLALTFSKKNSLNDDIQLDFEIELMHGNGNGL